MTRIWEAVFEPLILVLVVINLSEIAFLFAIHHETGVYANTKKFVPPSGYLLNQEYLTTDKSRCILIRLATDSCPYCKKDHNLYATLATKAKSSGCVLVALSPRAGELRTTINSSPLEYVSMPFARNIVPFSTPQTILLDDTGKILWDWEGAMNDLALSNAIKSLPHY